MAEHSHAPLLPEAQRYADAFLAAWVADVADAPPPGAIRRGQVAWFTDGTERYYALQVMSDQDLVLDQQVKTRARIREEEWYHEGAGADREHTRTWAIAKRPEIAALEEAICATLSEDFPDDDGGLEWDVSAAIAFSLASRMRDALLAAGLHLAPDFAVLPRFVSLDLEREEFEAVNPPDVVASLIARGDLPPFLTVDR